jgi:hypothetical protein
MVGKERLYRRNKLVLLLARHGVVSLKVNMLLATDAGGSLAKDTTGTFTTVAFPRLATAYLPPTSPESPTSETAGAGVVGTVPLGK